MMNKKGDISITILVLGIVALCFLTILSFITSERGDEGSIVGVGLMETMYSVLEEQDFYNDPETNFEGIYGEVFEKGNIRVDLRGGSIIGEYFVEETNFKFSWPPYEIKEKTLVSIEYNK